jgi:hypothetical protein
MQKIVYLILIVFLLPIKSLSQDNDTLLHLDKTDLPRARFISSRTFTGESLFGYMDGGAELYLEYGFSSALITEIVLEGGRFKTEVFRMNGPYEAFGIFSVSKYKCRNRPSFAEYTCQNRYQLQICVGSYYVSIINSTGTSSDSIASLKIGEALVHKITEASADLTTFFPGKPVEEIRINSVLAKGKLGLMNGAPDFEDILKDASGYTAALFSDKNKTIISVKFRSTDDLLKFASARGWKAEIPGNGPQNVQSGETITKTADNLLIVEVQK